MGSFNVACSASNLSINRGDKIVFIPLIINKFISSLENILTTKFMFNDDLYQPFLLPIKGTYDDYGRLENIKKDINTEFISSLYGYTIEVIIKGICDGDKLIKKEGYLELPKLAGMFVLENIYNDFCSASVSEYPDKTFYYNDINYIKNMNVNSVILEKLGFVFVKKEQFLKTYSKKDNVVFLSNYGISINESKNNIYEISKFISSWNKTTGDNLNLDIFKNFDYIKENILQKIKEEEIEITSIEKKNKIEKDIYKRILKERVKEILENNLYCSKWSNFEKYLEIYIENKNEELLNLLIEMRKFQEMMVCGNILYKPSFNGLQFGSNAASKFILKSIRKHLNG
jgi:hypothetical protein